MTNGPIGDELLKFLACLTPVLPPRLPLRYQSAAPSCRPLRWLARLPEWTQRSKLRASGFSLITSESTMRASRYLPWLKGSNTRVDYSENTSLMTSFTRPVFFSVWSCDVWSYIHDALRTGAAQSQFCCFHRSRLNLQNLNFVSSNTF